MLFNSLTFVVFFAIVLALHNAPFPWKVKKTNLLLASYFFYAAWNPPFVILLWLSTVVDWFVARRIYRTNDRHKKKMLLLVSLCLNLGLLAYFKYGGFLLENFIALMDLVGLPFHPAAPDIILPVGISFYTFQTLAYSLDVYLDRAKPSDSFLDFALFVTFFPQLVAGPIVRPTELVPQFREARTASRNQLIWGLGLMTLGLFQKLVIADTMLAPASEEVFGARESLYFFDAWLGVLAFAGQIFSDFAGYSTTAIGAALCLGFALPENFNFPYAAIGFSDFWRRWHISLSTWLRDYLYIPLGGNRKGKGRTFFNLMTTMFLGGLWHGASWTFAFWGVLHGIYLIGERAVRDLFGDKPWTGQRWVQIGLGLLTFYLICISWVFFRAQNFEGAGSLLAAMHGFYPDGIKILRTLDLWKVGLVMPVMVLVHWLMRNTTLETLVSRTPWWLTGLCWAVLLFLLIINQGGGNAFIYFQF